MDFAIPAGSRVKLKGGEKRYKYFELVRELKKLRNIGNWCARCSHQKIDTDTGRLDKKRTSVHHPNCSIVEIGQNTKKSPGDLWKLAITHTPMENYQLTMMWKTLERVKNEHNDGNDNGMKLPNQDKIRTLGKKGTLQILGDTGSWHDQTRGDERKN